MSAPRILESGASRSGRIEGIERAADGLVVHLDTDGPPLFLPCDEITFAPDELRIGWCISLRRRVRVDGSGAWIYIVVIDPPGGGRA